MGLFSRKKKKPSEKEKLPEMKPLPKMPEIDFTELPKVGQQREELNFPSYEGGIGPLKNLNEPGAKSPVLDLPTREPGFRRASEMPPGPVIRPAEVARPRRAPPISRPMPRHEISGPKPIFVKIDKYKEAMHNIDAIREKCEEASHLLDEIKELRIREDQQLEAWHSQIERIKSKLLNIDKSLFEV